MPHGTPCHIQFLFASQSSESPLSLSTFQSLVLILCVLSVFCCFIGVRRSLFIPSFLQLHCSILAVCLLMRCGQYQSPRSESLTVRPQQVPWIGLLSFPQSGIFLHLPCDVQDRGSHSGPSSPGYLSLLPIPPSKAKTRSAFQAPLPTYVGL